LGLLPCAGAQPAKKARKEKPMYLRDVLYQQAVEGAAEASSSDSEGTAGAGQQPRSYAQEQQELKQAFLQAFDEEVEGGGEEEEQAAGGEEFGAGVLQQRKKRQRAAAADDEGQEDDAATAAAVGSVDPDEARVQQLLDGYFGREEEMTADDKFLKRYILNKV
jgi:protein KRI1